MPITTTPQATAVAQATGLPTSTTFGDAITYLAKIAPQAVMTPTIPAAVAVTVAADAAAPLAAAGGLALSS